MNDEIREILQELENMYEISELEEQVNNINKIRDYINNLQQENERLKEQVNQYENPDDMTLFYMWLDEKAKDKMKHLQQENQRLNSQLDFIGEQNKYIDKLEKGYKNKVDEIGKLTSRIYKAIEYIKANCSYDEDTNMCCDDLFCGDVDNLLNILQNGSEGNDTSNK